MSLSLHVRSVSRCVCSLFGIDKINRALRACGTGELRNPQADSPDRLQRIAVRRPCRSSCSFSSPRLANEENRFEDSGEYLEAQDSVRDILCMYRFMTTTVASGPLPRAERLRPPE